MKKGGFKILFFFYLYCIYLYIYTHTEGFLNYCWDVKKQRKRADNVMLLVTEQNVPVSSTS